MFEIGLIGTSTKFKPFKEPEPEIPSVELVTELVGMPEQERKRPKNRPKHTRKRIHQAKKNFLEKFKTASKTIEDIHYK